MNIEIPEDLIREGIALGTERALAESFRIEVRAFLQDYFDCLDKSEAAAFLGVSERTIEELWKDSKIPKDTALGIKLPRTSLAALKELLTSGRIKARTGKTSPTLHALKPAA